MSQTAAATELPLAGIRVIGATNVLAGPYLEQLLADMGAEVIHVERPGVGDDSRRIPPQRDGVSLTWLIANRNKKSITLNLKSARGAELFKRLAARADVVADSSRPGVMDRLGLGWSELSRLNPRLVMTAISGFGQTGPYADRAGYNQTAQAAAGFMSLTGFPDGPPLRTAAIIGDYMASLYAAFGTMVALHHAQRTGRGQLVDVGLFESMMAILGPALQEFLTLGTVRQRTGNWAPTMAPSNVYPAADGEVMVVAGNDDQWRRLSATMGRPELADDPDYATPSARVAHVAAVDAVVAAWTRGIRVADAVAALEAAGLPCSAVNAIDGVVAHPQVAARELIATVDHPVLGATAMFGVIPKLSLTPGQVRTPPPQLGEHNREIYCGLLGLAEAELAELGAEGTI